MMASWHVVRSTALKRSHALVGKGSRMFLEGFTASISGGGLRESWPAIRRDKDVDAIDHLAKHLLDTSGVSFHAESAEVETAVSELCLRDMREEGAECL